MSERPASLFELENRGHRGWEFCLEVEHLRWERVGKGPEALGGGEMVKEAGIGHRTHETKRPHYPKGDLGVSRTQR